MGEALERLGEDPAPWLRQGITAIYETFRSHRAVTLAAADALDEPEVRDLWASVMEGFVQLTAAAIEAERARGSAPDGIPARDLAISLNPMNERVLQMTFAGQAPRSTRSTCSTRWSRSGWAPSTAALDRPRTDRATIRQVRPAVLISG